MRLDDAALCGVCEPLLIFGFFQQRDLNRAVVTLTAKSRNRPASWA
jgi:hypothetical protein